MEFCRPCAHPDRGRRGNSLNNVGSTGRAAQTVRRWLCLPAQESTGNVQKRSKELGPARSDMSSDRQSCKFEPVSQIVDNALVLDRKTFKKPRYDGFVRTGTIADPFMPDHIHE